ncbi:MAG: hypothetical protein LBT71_09225 [Azoarcus sp.]|jgi:hypothetical protein|nr:hypothetical protein [Azoarcus sp.]
MSAADNKALTNGPTGGAAVAPVIALPARLRQALAPSLLLLVWDVDRLCAVAARRVGGSWHFSEEGSSRLVDFAPALDEALARLEAAGVKPPRRCYLAARFIVPARVDLPVAPDKPRPLLQMRELARAEVEPAVAEAGALWTIGAVLAARGAISPGERERIALELAVRREQSNEPTYFGQVACDLGLIGKEDVQAALRVQEKLQTLESALACGWTGGQGETGEPPVWLASATGLTLWNQFETACKRRGLKLLGGLPLAWSLSEPAAARRPTDEQEGDRVALEIHAEEIVAVLRRRGRVVSARSEGRMERSLAFDWLARFIADWRAAGIDELAIVCREADDEMAGAALCDDFAQRWGKPPRLVGAGEACRSLLECLVRQYKLRAATLPVVRFGEPPRPVWKQAGVWHILCPLLVAAAATGLGVRQRMEIDAIQARFDRAELDSKRTANVRQQEANVIGSAKRDKEELDTARQQLARLAPEVDRLQAIEGMANRLPQLLHALARNIGDDVVLEVVRNSRSGGNIGDVMILGWTIEHSSAQAFASRMQAALSSLGYTVAQTDVRAGPGRDGRPGYFVSFWLIPHTPAEELGSPEEAGAANEAGGGER